MEAKKSILIYSISRGFARFVKYYLENEYHIDVCREANCFEIEFNSYEAAFVTLDDSIDVLNLIKIRRKVKCVFWNSNNREINLALKDLEGITNINLELSKADLMKLVKNKIRYLQDTEQDTEAEMA